VLDRPVVRDVPARLPADLDPLVGAAVAALLAVIDGEGDASDRIGELARAGVVAIRTTHGALAPTETLLGWVLVRTWGDPDAASLAAAARLRASRLARERRQGCGGPS
jgi:hypothetical protein